MINIRRIYGMDVFSGAYLVDIQNTPKALLICRMAVRSLVATVCGRRDMGIIK